MKLDTYMCQCKMKLRGKGIKTVGLNLELNWRAVNYINWSTVGIDLKISQFYDSITRLNSSHHYSTCLSRFCCWHSSAISQLQWTMKENWTELFQYHVSDRRLMPTTTLHLQMTNKVTNYDSRYICIFR